MSSPAAPNSLVNPLATVEQLERSSSQLDGIPADLETSIRFAACRFVQAAGVLLRLPQDVTAQALVTYTRFWLGAEGGSLKIYGAEDIAIASIYLVTKLSAYPKAPRTINNVCAYLITHPQMFLYPSSTDDITDLDHLFSSHISEGQYQIRRARMMKYEATILRTLGFQTHIALPFTLCINYLQTLEVFQHSRSDGSKVAQRAFQHLNGALLSPQLLYLTHQPPALATAAIYLAARELGVKLADGEWWEVFDTTREELGFLVVAMTSMEDFAATEVKLWGRKMVPMTVEEVEEELRRRQEGNDGA